ncbi:hypothetical protein N8I77_010188 [Diaporthe amygdali]|uniref:Uncharacterized protein n=1 Tax=Phomopsis amygdali TaxID=1214568 RepID=A0AAD9VZ11_PHOAM|nr:hypothetical protein N8I77_010188 [Diaporthe amygdali]
MGGVPSKPGDPSRPLEVIGAGFSRTGTMSMQLALEELLNGPVMHGATHILFREDELTCPTWTAAFGRNWTRVYEAREAGDKARTLKLLRELVGGFAGITDLPGIDFVPELLELYPDAKVVLVTRDPARWWESFGKVLNMAQLRFLSILAAPMPGLRWFPGTVMHWHKGASNLMEEKKGRGTPLGPELIELHNEMVKSVVPPKQLLVMDMGEGWEPLSRFLGKKTPEKPFPRVNDAEAAESVANGIMVKCLLAWAGIFAVGGISVYAARCLIKR